MAMVVKNNMSATRTLNTLDKNEKTRNKSSTNAATGMKINSAQDDASGYSISERMRVRIRALDQANQNTQNDAALMKTAGGAVDNTVEILRALKEKAINAANDSNTDEDRLIIQKEAHQLIDQINDNALVQFNGKYLIDGSKNNAAVSTQTILLNQNLANATGITTGLTTLANRVGDSLEIQTGDRWEVSYVLNGTTHHTDGEVTSATCLYHLLRVDGTRYMLGDNTIQKILQYPTVAITIQLKLPDMVSPPSLKINLIKTFTRRIKNAALRYFLPNSARTINFRALRSASRTCRATSIRRPTPRSNSSSISAPKTKLKAAINR